MDAESAQPVETASARARRSAAQRLEAAQNKVVVIGLSHKTASVQVRETLAVPEKDWQAVQRKIAALPHIKEAAIISTCNRHEIYFVLTGIADRILSLTHTTQFNSHTTLLAHHTYR